MKILLVGGTWTVEPRINPETNRRSHVVDIMREALKNYCEDNYPSTYELDMYNGGCYYDLETIINKTPNYDIVFWWANVPDNSLPKIRNVKEVAPYTMLVTSKRNDGDKYSFMELTQKALASKSNLVFEFKKTEREVSPGQYEKLFRVKVFDPLGCMWYDDFDVEKAILAAMERLGYLRSITRQKTIKSKISKIDIPDESEFIEVVRKYAETFYKIFNPGKDIQRFLGNASLRVQLNIDSTRCMRGMPSFKKDNMIFVSQRNIDKQFIAIENFVPCYMEGDKIYYCGDKKPSVDTPIQMRLYDALPNIRYIIHSHCYIDGAPSTTKSIPCGAIEEVDEVLSLIDQMYGNRNLNYYAINLKGHGSLLMASEVNAMKDVKYVGRQLPEAMF